jgi:hypothetical protein
MLSLFLCMELYQSSSIFHKGDKGSSKAGSNIEQ